MAKLQRTDRHRRKIIGADLGQRAAIAADGGAHGVTDERFA